MERWKHLISIPSASRNSTSDSTSSPTTNETQHSTSTIAKMPMLASEALATINAWESHDTIDNMLRAISKTYRRKSHKVAEWAAHLTEKRIWRGGNDSSRRKVHVRMSTRARAKARAKARFPKRKATKSKSKSPSPSSGTVTPAKVWTKGQREEATRRKADEADAAAVEGVRRSRRARVPSEKVLNAE